jgi:hypothetical protein
MSASQARTEWPSSSQAIPFFLNMARASSSRCFLSVTKTDAPSPAANEARPLPLTPDPMMVIFFP